MSFLKSQYYDHPEGEDAFGKIVATNKYAFATGLIYSTFDVVMYSRTQGYLPTLARFAYNTGPMMGMATAFTLSTYVATNLRKKDDKLNYVIGGIAAGAVYGAWRRNHVTGAMAAFFFAIAGAVKKLSKQEDWEFFPKIAHQHGSLRVSANDYTWTKDPKSRQNLQQQEQEINQENKEIDQEKNELNQEKNELSQEKNEFNQEKNELNQEKKELNQEKKELEQEKKGNDVSDTESK